MGFFRAVPLGLVLLLSALLLPSRLWAQGSDRIWGRVHTVSGEIHEGFIRWDRNEGSWVDQLDGSKASLPFEFVDWWEMAHPGDGQRDRVIELAGYRITWDDDEPDFPSSHESGIRMGHIRRLTVEDDVARLELRSGIEVELEGGATDLGSELREVLVMDGRGSRVELEWEDLAFVEFMAARAGVQPRAQRLHGTVEVREGPSFTGFIAWASNEILTSDTLNGEDQDGRRREILFRDVATIHPGDDASDVLLSGGETVRLSGNDDVDDGNRGIQISDPDLGMVSVDWDDIEVIRFHPPRAPVSLDSFDGGHRLQGTVVTADSTELTGWIKWDADEEYSWELLDGNSEGMGFDIEFGKIASIERHFFEITSVNLGPAGVSVSHPLRDGALVTLLDGRAFEMDGSNDVDESISGIFVLEFESGWLPEDEEAEWVMVRWGDFLGLRLDGGEGR